MSTRKLVDSYEEQSLLEELLESVKPPAPDRPLHYLLSTPFRYPPLRHGSRYGSRDERGIWYGSELLRTAFAETAYYRLLFLDGSEATLAPLRLGLTSFRALLRSSNAVDLLAPPFDGRHEVLTSKADYRATQKLGRAMRAAGVEFFRYPSARDNLHGANLAVLSVRAFAKTEPSDYRNWHCVVDRDGVEVLESAFVSKRERYHYPREQFLVGKALPSPAC